jgi:hypothetical protein
MIMRKYVVLSISVFALTLPLLFLSSCHKDKTVVHPKLSFATSTATVKESDGVIDVKLKLDRPSPEAVSINYTLGGTAVDKVAAGTGNYDYEITSDYLEAKIKKGDTVALITIQLYSDFSLEDDETIEINITNTDSDNIDITRNDNTTITVDQEDGMIIVLQWPAPTATANADMDLFVREGATIGNWDGILTGSVQETFTGPELTFIPTVFGSGAFGLSYTYYDGTLNPLLFTSTFAAFTDGAVEPQAQQALYNGSYTTANLNKWTDPTTSVVVQTFTMTAGVFSTPTQITPPASSSRVGSTPSKSSKAIALVKGTPTNISNRASSFLKVK